MVEGKKRGDFKRKKGRIRFSPPNFVSLLLVSGRREERTGEEKGKRTAMTRPPLSFTPEKDERGEERGTPLPFALSQSRLYEEKKRERSKREENGPLPVPTNFPCLGEVELPQGMLGKKGKGLKKREGRLFYPRPSSCAWREGGRGGGCRGEGGDARALASRRASRRKKGGKRANPPYARPP